MTILIKFGKPIGKTAVAQTVMLGLKAPAMAGHGSSMGPGAGRMSQSRDIEVIRTYDSISPELNRHHAQGTIFELVTIEFYQPKKILFLIYTLKSTFISGIIYASQPDLIENLQLSVTTITAEYFNSSSTR